MSLSWPVEVLVASADAETRLSLTDLLAKDGLNPVFCSSLSEAQEVLVRQPICLVFSDYRLPDGDFHDVLYEVKRNSSSVPVVVINRVGDWHQYLNVLKSGAFDYIDCSWPRREVQRVVRQVLNAISVHSSEQPAERQQDFRGNP